MTAFVEPPVPRAEAVPDREIRPRVPATEVPEVLNNFNEIRAATLETANMNGHVEDPFKLSSEFAYTPCKMRVFTIGAGFSGLLMAHKFYHRFPEMRDIVDHTIFEARSDVGGTWLANNYPGVQCDVPAHIYVSELYCTLLIADLPRHFRLTLTRTGRGSMPVVATSWLI